MSRRQVYVSRMHVMVIRDKDRSEDEIDSLRFLKESVRASAEKIVFTYLLPGAKREIFIPESIRRDVVSRFGRDDPEVFDMAKDYVFQAMERDEYPGFMNLSRLQVRMSRGSKSKGPGLIELCYVENHIQHFEMPNPSCSAYHHMNYLAVLIMRDQVRQLCNPKSCHSVLNTEI